MKHGQKALLALLGGWVILGQTSPGAAISVDNPYMGIPSRNPFGLRSPPPPPDPASLLPPKPPPTPVILSGITTYGGKKAYMKSNPPGAKQPTYYTLKEGERDGAVEVITIDDINKAVTINNSGVPQTITFPTNSASAIAAPPGTIPLPVGPAAVNPVARPVQPPTLPLPTRGVRTTPAASSRTPATSTSGDLAMAGSASAAPVVVPSRPAAPEPPPLTIDQQEVLIELTREQLKAAGDELHSIYPPTSLGDQLNAQQQAEADAAAEAEADQPATPAPRQPSPPIPGRGGPLRPF